MHDKILSVYRWFPNLTFANKKRRRWVKRKGFKAIPNSMALNRHMIMETVYATHKFKKFVIVIRL